MSLDVNTLFMVTIYVEAILGLLLLFAWAQNMAIRAVAWWGFAHLIRAPSVVLFGMYGSAPELITIDLANALLFTAFAVTWTGARVFDGRPIEPVYLVTGAVLWLLVCRLPVMADAIEMRAMIASGIITAYTWLTAYEFWRGRAEPLVSRWPAIFMLFAHGALFLLRTPLVAILPWSPSDSPHVRQRLADRSEFRGAAVHDLYRLHPVGHGQGAYRTAPPDRGQCRSADRHCQPPVVPARRRPYRPSAMPAIRGRAAVLLIDLDHFKTINDRFGHALGDRVLEIFAAATLDSVRGSDLIGRIGGEEFAAVLYDTTSDRAVAVAERIRQGFATAAQEVDGRPVCATVSIGVVHSDADVLDVPELLAQADQALDFAKENGRNRVEVASLEMLLKRKDEGSATSSTAPAAISAQARPARGPVSFHVVVAREAPDLGPRPPLQFAGQSRIALWQ